MARTNETVNQNRHFGKRVGFWLGLLLFAAILAMPTPESMREVARTQSAGDVAAATQASLAACGQMDAGAESTAWQAAHERAVERRARVILAAAAVSALVACWWITVAVPIPVTSLLPLLLFPVVGVLGLKEAAAPYANPNVYLFMGGFIIALALERWGLHRRIALHIVRMVGGGRPRIVLGFMIASAFLSMWISNTATALMMLPIGMAIITAVGEMGDQDERGRQNFAAALMLGIAYASSIGGVATPIGTPPNIAFHGQFAELFPNGPEIGFGQWALIYIPLVVLFVPVVWLILTRVTCRVTRAPIPVGPEIIQRDLARLGPMRGPEKTVLGVFVATAVLWMTRSIPFGTKNYGWAALAEWLLAPGDGQAGLFQADYISDASVALGMAVLLFLLPGERDEQGQRRRLMDWETTQRLPWGILILFGGGFSIAAGFKASGLSYWCGQVFAGLDLSNPLFVVLGTCLLMTFLTEITSNTATTQVMLPILARVSQTIGVHPLMLMLPATISASCAFMLPVATPPNAIVFGSGMVDMRRMVRTGLILNLIGVVLVTATFYLAAKPILGLDLHVVPDWAQ